MQLDTSDTDTSTLRALYIKRRTLKSLLDVTGSEVSAAKTCEGHPIAAEDVAQGVTHLSQFILSLWLMAYFRLIQLV